MPSRCGKNAWQFTHKAYTLEMFAERIEMFVAHPALRGMQMFTISVVDETRGYFSVVRDHVVSHISFTFEDGLQCASGGFFLSPPVVLSQRNTKPFRFSCAQDGKKCASPDIPYLMVTPQSHKEGIAKIPGIKVGRSYLFSVAYKEGGLYEANICAHMLPPDMYELKVFCSISDHMFRYTKIHILSDDEVKSLNHKKRELRDIIRGIRQYAEE